MIHAGAPHVIHSDQQLAEYTRALFQLTAKPEPSEDEIEAIELLSLLIERYEDDRYTLPEASPGEVLRFFMDRNGLQQKDLVPEMGSVAAISLILSGKRNMTLRHMAALSERFRVPVSVFLSGKVIELKAEAAPRRRPVNRSRGVATQTTTPRRRRA